MNLFAYTTPGESGPLGYMDDEFMLTDPLTADRAVIHRLATNAAASDIFRIHAEAHVTGDVQIEVGLWRYDLDDLSTPVPERMSPLGSYLQTVQGGGPVSITRWTQVSPAFRVGHHMVWVLRLALIDGGPVVVAPGMVEVVRWLH